MTTALCFRQHEDALARLYAANPMIRAVNFHNTPRVSIDKFRQDLSHYSKCFSSVNESELDLYLSTGNWQKAKPGLLIAVYEGFRNNYEVLAPLVQEYGFVGWFFIITGFLNCPIAEQLTYAEGHRIRMNTREYTDGRYAMSWEEVRELDRNHVICSHTRTHAQLSVIARANIESEVAGAQEDLRKQLGHNVRTFASRSGPAHGEHPGIDTFVKAAGYNFVVSNFRIQRIRAAAGLLPLASPELNTAM